MKIYRTRQYRRRGDGEILWFERYCTSRRQYGALKNEMKYLRVTRMELHVAEIPDEMWQPDQAEGGS